jgi:inorganic pyrophosphatase
MNVRTIGMLVMEDDGGVDEKLLCVLAKDPRWDHIQDIDDVPSQVKNEIEHFFQHYKDLEPGKWVKLDGWRNRAAAEKVLAESYENYKG